MIVAEALLEVVQAMGFEHGVEDLRHALLLEDPPVGTQPGAGQREFHHGAVAGAAKAGVALADQIGSVASGGHGTANGFFQALHNHEVLLSGTH